VAESECLEPSISRFWDAQLRRYGPYQLLNTSTSLRASLSDYAQLGELTAFQALVAHDFGGGRLPLGQVLEAQLLAAVDSNNASSLLAPSDFIVAELLSTLQVATGGTPAGLVPEMHDLLRDTLQYNTLRDLASSLVPRGTADVDTLL
jgi:hypothetical protein